MTMRYRSLILLAYTLAPAFLLGQARVVISNNAFIVIDNSAYVVIDNPATNAITTTGTGGNIVTESEFDRVKWNIGTGTGTYVMPFTSSTGIKIPFTVNITTAGAGAGHFLFSTYNGPIWNNDTYRPTDVTHMFDYATGSVNNSDHAIDRFWIIDASGYGTRPTASLGFTYIDAEHTPVGNNIIEGDLGAQRFNNSLNIWGDYLPVGAINTVANTVVGVPASPADFFRSWTLSEITNPLSVELISFNAVCDQTKVDVQWSTATETNTSTFYIEASVDGNTFDRVASAAGAGNSSSVNYYHTEISAGSYLYFRLVLENTDGSTETFQPVYANCGSGVSENTWAYYSPVSESFVLQSTGYFESNASIFIIDVSGRIMSQSKNPGENTSYISVNTNGWSNGMYMLVLQNGTERKEFKLILSH